jgi:two-component system, OmpR family, sensor histidine kinase TctE
LRASVLRHPLEMSEGQRVALIAVAHSDRARRDAVRSAMIAVLGRQALFPLLAALAIVWVVRRLLKPINDIRAQVDARDPHDDNPFEPAGLTELNPVTDALNGLLARLAAARLAQERFVANASHQLRTPLSVLKVQLQSALREPENSQKRLREMLAAVDRSARLTDQLLALARVHKGRPARQADSCNLRQAVDEAIVELSPLIADKGLQFSFKADEAGAVSGAAWMIGELLRNLLLNAIQHSPPGAELRVEVHASAGGPRVEIIDGGPGIEPDLHAALFEPFATVTGRPGGSGLGLAICKEIAAAIGATLRFSTGASGSGLNATVLFSARGA